MFLALVQKKTDYKGYSDFVFAHTTAGTILGDGLTPVWEER